MQGGDLNKVWETKALKKKPAHEEAKKMLDRIAKQVQPIMQKHKWRVKLLSEFCPKNPNLLGVIIGGGVQVKLRLRRPNRDRDFYPFDEVLDTMLHELCHNAHGPHNASFYKLWDELRKECEELMAKGISGTGQGFDLPGKRLGGFAPRSSLREATSGAAQGRIRTASLLPPGPNRLGGDKSIMSVLSPVQAAAMAAERRRQDEIWCAAALVEVEEEEEEEEDANTPAPAPSTTSKPPRTQKRSIVEDTPSLSATKGKRVCHSEPPTPHPSSVNIWDSELVMWDCETCTLLNPSYDDIVDDDAQPFAPVCAVCGTPKPKAAAAKYKSWSCKFCTLENDVKLDKCLACGQWRYSRGVPVSAQPPNLGT